MRHKSKKILLALFILILLVLVGYFVLAYYYRNTFSLNTWINGVYCTGKSVEDVNAELLSVLEAPIIVVMDKEGASYEIPLENAEYSGDYMIPLRDFLWKQDPYLWIDNVTLHKNHTLQPAISYNEEKLRDLWEALPFVKAERERKDGISIEYSKETGYYLEEGIYDRIHLDKAYGMFIKAIQEGEKLVVYDDTVYYDVPLNTEQQETWKCWKKIDSYQSTGLYYDMGEDKICLDEALMASFLLKEEGMLLTEEENLIVDEDAVDAFVEELASKYDTLGKEREFLTTEGDTVKVSGGIYGFKMNQKAEKAFLKDYLTQVINGQVLSEEIRMEEGEFYHQPSYEQAGLVQGTNDIGNTYIEVDMSNQMLYYYQNGELQLETAIVTGNMRRRMDTPAGVNYVYAKQKNRTLRGPGYASFVKYWMPVKGSIGIHDASWRDEFGGDIYLTGGSHGCINLPTDKAGELYDMAEIGTPVVMYYRD